MVTILNLICKWAAVMQSLATSTVASFCYCYADICFSILFLSLGFCSVFHLFLLLYRLL